MIKKQTTFQPKGNELQTAARWYLIDAQGQTLGKLAERIARILRGKHRPTFTPHMNSGDHVVVINARGIVVTGKKGSDKQYKHYTGYPSGLRQRSFDEVMERDPTQPLTRAVKGMLPHNSLGAANCTNLRVYAGPEHEHVAQRPELITFGPLGEIRVANG